MAADTAAHIGDRTGAQTHSCNQPLHEFAARELESTLTTARHGVTLAVRSLRPVGRPSTSPDVEHSSTTSPQGTVHEELVEKVGIRAHLEEWQCCLFNCVVVDRGTRHVGAAVERVRAAEDFVVPSARSRRLSRAIARASVRLASVRSRLFAQTIAALQPLTGLTALTGPSGEPEHGSYVMARLRLISPLLIAASSCTSSTPSWPSYGFSWNGMTARAE